MSNAKIKIPSAAEMKRRKAENDRVARPLFARSVRYDRIANDLTFALPRADVTIHVSKIPHLAKAGPEQLEQLRLYGSGSALELRELDLDFSVPELIRSALGLSELQQRIAGRARSKSKSAASRANGTKGGRPRKTISG